MAKWTVGYLDYSAEQSSANWYSADPLGAAFDVEAWELLADNIADAVDAITLGTRGKRSVSYVVETGSKVLPTDKSAQRESGLRVFFEDDVTGDVYSLVLPCPDHDLLAQQGTDNVDLTITEMAAFITAFEAGAVSKANNSVTVISAKIVGRRA